MEALRLPRDSVSGSWVATCIATGEVFEFFDESNALKALESKFFIVETACQYLSRLNTEKTK